LIYKVSSAYLEAFPSIWLAALDIELSDSAT